jgi:hypothetical protein
MRRGASRKDLTPARTDPVETLSACYRTIRYSERLLGKFRHEKLREMIRQGDVIQVFDTFQRLMLGESLS